MKKFITSVVNKDSGDDIHYVPSSWQEFVQDLLRNLVGDIAYAITLSIIGMFAAYFVRAIFI